jgi:aconitate hydratase
LKKQGLLALTFSEKIDYDKIQEDDQFDICGLTDFQPGKTLVVLAHHYDGSVDKMMVNHTFNKNQITWFKSGSALNTISGVENIIK